MRILLTTHEKGMAVATIYCEKRIAVALESHMEVILQDLLGAVGEDVVDESIMAEGVNEAMNGVNNLTTLLGPKSLRVTGPVTTIGGLIGFILSMEREKLWDEFISEVTNLN